MDAKTTVYAKWLIRILIGLVVGYLIWHYWPAKKWRLFWQPTELT